MDRQDCEDDESLYFENYAPAAARDAQHKRESILRNVGDLKLVLKDGGGSEVQKILSLVEQDLNDQKHFLDLVAGPSDASTISQQVFDTPELLEHILLYLHNPDLLRAYSISRQFNATIEGSPKIQRQLGLQATAQGDITLPLQAVSGFTIFTDRNRYHKSSSSSGLLIGIKASRHIPRLGSRSRSMLICQPPIENIKVFTSCCTSGGHRGGTFDTPLEFLHAKSGSAGLTAGDLVDAVERLAPEHSKCPDAPPYHHDEKGVVNVRFTFAADLDVDDTEPLVQTRRRRLKQKEENRRRQALRSETVAHYISAKRLAREKGQLIPTLEEYQASEGRNT
ncbi:hypothetical protein LTR37_018854 [Vermiconidia calcicola]|uniref:Uncharacterized protein n=1 Tax=Vermiconidia calcicola TaxID=1690605 RepID=A0ACC3MFZ2_9PEZI|nr:hypothetical protein LTR37_018854 [Vermiconidia calcicola]